MKASEIIAQVSNLYQSSQKNDSSAKTTATKSTDFQDIMNNNLNTNQESARDYSVANKNQDTSKLLTPNKNASSASQTRNKAHDDQYGSNADKLNKAQSTKGESTKTQATKSQKQTVKTEASETQTTNAESNNPISDKMDKLSDKIKETVMESLQITEDQLENIMSILGLNYLQLLEPSNLAQVFMQMNQLTDSTQMLMNSQFSDQFNLLLDQVNQIDLQEFNLTNEDVVAYLEAMPDNVVNTNTATAINDETIVQESGIKQLEEVQEVDQSMVTDQDDTENSVKVHVEKYSEQSTSSQSDEQQSNQPHGQEQNESSIQDANLNTIINNLSKVSTIQNFGDQLVQVEQVRDVVNQVVEQIKIVIKPEHTSMEMHLNPENLGKVNLLVAQKDGVLTAQFTVQNEMAKEALESQLQTLKDSFTQQGIKVEVVEVTVSNLPFSQDNMSDGNKEQQKSSGKRRNINLADLDINDELTDDEELKINIMQQNGNSVDYSA